MAATGRTLMGQAFVSKLFDHYAMLTKPGVVGGIFAPPGSVVGLQPTVSLRTVLSLGDVVVFEADAQTDRNGARWCARPCSVRRVQNAHIYDGSGVVVSLDNTAGHYGYVQTARGLLYFAASAVRPPTRDVTQLLHRQQKVRFRAVRQCAQDAVPPWRAIVLSAVVCSAFGGGGGGARLLSSLADAKPTKPIGSATFSQVVSTCEAGRDGNDPTKNTEGHRSSTDEHRQTTTTQKTAMHDGAFPTCRPLDQILHWATDDEKAGRSAVQWTAVDDGAEQTTLCSYVFDTDGCRNVFVHPTALSQLSRPQRPLCDRRQKLRRRRL